MGESVRLNVYSPTGSQHAVYHTGLEVLGAEYVFGGGETSVSGVSAQRPRIPPTGSGWIFYQTVELGLSRLSREEIMRIVTEVRSEFPASSYDIVSRNCNHFSDALGRRLCGQGTPPWVNRLAGLGEAVRSAVGSAPGGAAAGRPVAKAEGAGGPAAAGLVARSAPPDGDLSGEVDWISVGLLNAREADTADSVRSQSLVSSVEGGAGELLLFFPLVAPVKLQALRLEAPDAARAPSRIRLFANQRNLDVDDASGGVPATQEFLSPAWATTGAGEAVAAKFEVNFLKFQNLSFLSVYLGRLEEEDAEAPIAVQGLRLVGRI